MAEYEMPVPVSRTEIVKTQMRSYLRLSDLIEFQSACIRSGMAKDTIIMCEVDKDQHSNNETFFSLIATRVIETGGKAVGS